MCENMFMLLVLSSRSVFVFVCLYILCLRASFLPSAATRFISVAIASFARAPSFSVGLF